MGLEVTKISHLFMTNPLNTLKKGLNTLRKQIDVPKSKLQADLKAGKTLTSSDEEQLDGAGNLVDEECIDELLEKASDYEKGVGGLSGADKGIVEKLQSLRGSIGAVAGKKCTNTELTTYLYKEGKCHVGTVDELHSRYR